MIRQLEVKINKAFGPYTKGQIVRVPCNDDGIPKSAYWRARFKDSEVDNCCSLKSTDVEEFSETLATNKAKKKSRKTSKA